MLKSSKLLTRIDWFPTAISRYGRILFWNTPENFEMLLYLSRELNQGSYAETNLETDYDEMM